MSHPARALFFIQHSVYSTYRLSDSANEPQRHRCIVAVASRVYERLRIYVRMRGLRRSAQPPGHEASTPVSQACVVTRLTEFSLSAGAPLLSFRCHLVQGGSSAAVYIHIRK